MSCSDCQTSLAGIEYVENDNKDLCMTCFNSMFGKTCTTCRTLIPPGTKFAAYDGKFWHKLCFQCTTCKTPLNGFRVGADDDLFYCSKCYDKKYAPKCIVCQTAIIQGSRHVEDEGRLFHEDCFRCNSQTCNKKLTDGYIPKGDKFYCEECYQELKSTETFTDTLICPNLILTELLRHEQKILKTIAQSVKTEIKPTIELAVKRFNIPKATNKNLVVPNNEQMQTVLHLFPDIKMNATVHNGSIQLLTGDLTKQNVDVIVVCSTSEVLFKTVLHQAGLVVTEEYNRLSTAVAHQDFLIETGPGNLNCKAILFLPLILPSNRDSTVLQNSITEFVSKSLQHIFYHPKIYRTVAFPAIGCGLLRCPVGIIANAMINAAVAKLTETMLYNTVAFVILPTEFIVHQRFADRLTSLQKPSEPFGYIECSFSKLTITLTAKQETNVKKCRSDIESHINTYTQTKSRKNEENLDIWTQSLVLTFYKYCLNDHILPTINFEQRKLTLIGKKESIDNADKQFLELTTHALKQTHLNNISRLVGWQYQIDPSSWQSYSYKCNGEIEYACTIKQLSEVNFTNEQSETCRINFQKRIETFNNRIRKIRRRDLTSYTLPTHWQNQSANCHRFSVNADTEEYKNLKQLFDSTMSGSYTSIKSIERIQNHRWYKQYAAHRDAMNERLKQETEKQLFHGCNEEATNNIIEECFNRSYAGANATLYGQGAYFATNAKYSHNYARPNAAGERRMFVVSVLVGKSIYGNTSMKVPPKGYDSTTDSNQIFVVYHDAQAYADYIIKYQ